MQQAKIEVRVKDAGGTAGIFQHLFIIHTNSEGKETLLRGGLGASGVFVGNIRVIKQDYTEGVIDWVKNAPRSIIATGTDAEMQSYVDKMWAEGQRINSRHYDYKMPTIGHIQNSNTVVAKIVKAAELELKLPTHTDGSPLNTPGVNSDFKHTETDGFFRENACGFMGGDCREYNKKVKEKLTESSRDDNPSSSMTIDQLFKDFEDKRLYDTKLTNIDRFKLLAQKAESQESFDSAEMYKNLAEHTASVLDLFDSLKTDTTGQTSEEQNNNEN